MKKDLAQARRLYLAAAAKGNGKAMHNLAVLYAEGIEGKPDYGTAAQWFRKAAQRGIADSQYNLGVLCARGLGTEKSVAESYKWFALAAAQGDRDPPRNATKSPPTWTPVRSPPPSRRSRASWPSRSRRTPPRFPSLPAAGITPPPRRRRVRSRGWSGRYRSAHSRLENAEQARAFWLKGSVARHIHR